MTTREANSFPRYEANEKPAALVTLGLGVQSSLLAIAPIALFPIVLAQAADMTAEFAAWAVFSMLVINGAATVVQAFRLGPVGAGMFVVPYPSPTTIPFCVLALQEGGTATLASLILVSGAFQIIVSLRMAVLRRLMTPTINGAILILLMLTLVPVVFDSLNKVPDDAADSAGPVVILVTFVVILGLLIRGSANWRVWASVIGLVVGSVVGAFFGLFDFEPVREASIVGLPFEGWHGLSFDFGAAFWSLLPVFLFLSIVALLQGNSIALATQRVSWRNPGAMDYRRVQGTALATGIGNLFSGLSAVMPLTTSPRGTAFAQQTGCASRYVGIVTGVLIAAAAFFPQVWSLLIGIPSPAIGVYIIILIGPLLLEGMKMIVNDGPDYRTSLVVGTAFVVGLGLQTGIVVLPIDDLWNAVFQKALTGGGLVLILLTVFAEFRRHRRRRLQVGLSMDELPRVNQFMEEFSSSHGWSDEMAARLQAVSEETMLILQEGQRADDSGRVRRLVVDIGSIGQGAELEFISVGGGDENLEDRIALLSQPLPEEAELELTDLEATVERDAPLRLVRHYAASVSHRQYFDTEIITLRVTLPSRR